MNKSKIIEICRRARRAKEISQTDVSLEAHIAQSRISQFENGYYSPEIVLWYYNNILSEAECAEIDVLRGI